MTSELTQIRTEACRVMSSRHTRSAEVPFSGIEQEYSYHTLQMCCRCVGVIVSRYSFHRVTHTDYYLFIYLFICLFQYFKEYDSSTSPVPKLFFINTSAPVSTDFRRVREIERFI